LRDSLEKRDQAKNAETKVRCFPLREENPYLKDIQDNAKSSRTMLLSIPLSGNANSIGTLALIAEADSIQALIQKRTSSWFISFVSKLLDNSISHEYKNMKLRMLNLYQTVSSALSYIGDLEELLRTIMSIVTTELLCEEGSVILYHDCRHEFQFFAVAGESEKDLNKICFPADQGIAGRALREGMPFIENDVRNCPFFYGDIDQLHGYETRSVLAVPLTLMDETVGVIEAINKFEDMRFTQEDQQTLVAIADEVALAIRNAKLFETVVESYCSRRQGDLNCRSCKRPLKSWTPCPLHLHEQSTL
jgi:hypothetical protein